MSHTLFLYLFDLKNIDRVHIWAAEAIARKLTSIAQYVDHGKQNVHCHWAELASLCIEIKRVVNFVTAMAGTASLLLD